MFAGVPQVRVAAVIHFRGVGEAVLVRIREVQPGARGHFLVVRQAVVIRIRVLRVAVQEILVGVGDGVAVRVGAGVGVVVRVEAVLHLEEVRHAVPVAVLLDAEELELAELEIPAVRRFGGEAEIAVGGSGCRQIEAQHLIPAAPERRHLFVHAEDRGKGDAIRRTFQRPAAGIAAGRIVRRGQRERFQSQSVG